MSDWLWTWSGESFGYISNDALYTTNGLHVAYVVQDGAEQLIFSVDGQYIGEVKDGDRLITKLSRLGRTRGSRSQRSMRSARSGRSHRSGRSMRSGYQDFPSRSQFEQW